MKITRENLQRFIAQYKDVYNVLIEPKTKQPWEADSWGKMKSGWLSIRGTPPILNHCEVKRMKGFSNQTISSSIYRDFIKAFIVYIYAEQKCSPQVLVAIHLNLKRLYVALITLKQQEHPMYLDTLCFQWVDEQLALSGYKNMFDAISYLCVVQSQLIALEITLNPLLHENKYASPNLAHKKKVAHKRKRADTVDDLSREGSDKLMSFTALKALAWISNNPTNQWEKFGCRIMDILLVTGMRINEVLYLPKDCWVEIDVTSERSGHHLTDTTGNKQKFFGLRYFAEKGASSYIHWLEPNAVKIVKRAIDDISQITLPFRKQAEFLVENQGNEIISWNKPSVTLEELCYYFLQSNVQYNPLKRYSPKNADNRVRDVTRAWVKNKKLKEIEKASKGSCYSRTAYEPVYCLQSLKQILLSYFPDPNNIYQYEFKLFNQQHRINLDELLIIAPPSALTLKRGTRILLAIQPLPELEIHRFIGGLINQTSIFDRHGFTEENGEKIRLTTHMARHNINTFLALAGMAEHQQAIAMGRRDITQNSAYQHLTLDEQNAIQHRAIEFQKHNLMLSQNTAISPYSSSTELVSPPGLTEREAIQFHRLAFDDDEDKAAFVRKATDKKALLGELTDSYHQIKASQGIKSAKEFIHTHGNYFHIVPNGACTRNIALHGCHKRLKCISGSGCANLHVTGRQEELKSIQYNLENMKENLKLLMDACDDRYQAAIEELKTDIAQLVLVYKKAQQANSKMIPVAVFPEGLLKNIVKPSETVVDRFANALPLQNSGTGSNDDV